MRLHRQWRFFQKKSQVTPKCDAEVDWSTYDFIHSKVEEKTAQQRQSVEYVHANFRVHITDNLVN